MRGAHIPGRNDVAGFLPGIRKAKNRTARPDATSHGGCHDKY
jgi:hypothetical protein